MNSNSFCFARLAKGKRNWSFAFFSIFAVRKQNDSYYMEDKEMFLWLATIKAAKSGEKEALIQLKVTNEVRKEQGLPTIEEEILDMLEAD